MTVHPQWRIAACLAAVPAAGFRAAVIAGLVSLAAMSAAHAQGRSEGSRADSSQGSQGGHESRETESRGDSAPGRSSEPDSPGKSASAPGQSAASIGSAQDVPEKDIAPGLVAPAADPAAAPSPPPGFDQSDALNAAQAQEIYTLKELLPRVTDRYGGKVIYVALWPDGDRLIYKFKLRTDRGDVRTIRMDAKTGRFIGLGAFFR